MEKDVVEQGSTWKSYEKSKAEMREERKWEECKEECIIMSSLKSQRDRFPCSSLMQALGQRKRERSGVRANEMMAADGRARLDAGFAGST